MRVIAAIVMLLVVGCEAEMNGGRGVVNDLDCVWSRRYQQCFCTATRMSRGYLTWVPAEVCRNDRG